MTTETLGPYRIDRELGSGGMGKVYAAVVDGPAPGLDLGAQVALKVVHPHLLETDGFLERFEREGRLGASVRHENVVRTLDCTAAGGTHFLVMEYVQGQTLASLCKELERVPEELCRHIGREVSKGLGAIHAAGIVHRDLKPENVIVATREARRGGDVAERATGRAGRVGVRREGDLRPDLEYVVKIMDLGIARLADESLRLSRTGAFVGSVEYAAPEQFRGEDLDARADLYALGVLLYEISAGTHPHRGGNFAAVMRRVINEKPRPLGEANPQLSAFFEEVVHTLLVKDPRGRFASATQLLGLLQDGEDSAWWHERARELQATTKRPIRRIRIPRETAVYGRDDELKVLRRLYDAASSGDGQVVLIDGEAGIGKSRLADELMGRLHSDGEEVNFLFGSYPPGGAASAAGAFSTAFHEQFGDAGAAPYLPQTPMLVPAFDALLHGDAAPAGAQPLTKDSLGTCFVHATRNLAAERTTVVLIEDLHFAPDEARALFAALAMAVPGHRVLLIGSMRPGVSAEWVASQTRLAHTTQMTVPRLGPKDLVRLLEDSMKSRHLAEELAGKIATKSDGNPFFAFEIIRGLREGQFLTQREDGSWVGTQIIEDIQIPSSVLDLVKARVSNLSEEERDLLDVACCWGYEFDPGLIGEVLGLPRIPLLKRFGQIERAHRLVRAAGRQMVFDHHQVQEALYGSLLEQLREEYHSALAEALETRTKAADQDPDSLGGALCVDLAEHYLKGARGESALRYLPAAQTHLEEGYLYDQVVALTERALAVPDLLAGVERATALLRLVAALDSMGRRARQEECVREAERLAEESGDDELRGKAATALGNLFWRISRPADSEAAYGRALEIALARGDQQAEANATGGLSNALREQSRLAEARAHSERQRALCREIGDRDGEAGATVNLGTVFSLEGRFDEAREHFERGLAFCREIGHRRFEANAEACLGSTSQYQGRVPEAKEHFERCLSLVRELGDRYGEANALGNLGTVFAALGRGREAMEHYERHDALSREIGDRGGEARAAANLGGVHLAEGRVREAMEHTERCLSLMREIGDRHGEATATGNLGMILHAAGRLGEARERLERALALFLDIGDRRGEASATGGLANVCRSEGRLHEAREYVERCLELSREMGTRQGESIALVNLGPTWHALGDLARARTALEASVAICREIGARYPEGYGLLSLGQLADEEGDGAVALQLTQESLDMRRAIGHGDGVADSLIELGDLLRRAGDADAARTSLDEALRLSREQGRTSQVALALALLACLPGGDSDAAVSALAETGEAGESARARWLLFRATGERAHLEDAQRQLDESLAKVPEEHHEAMLTNLRLNREIMAAWNGESVGAPDEFDEDPDLSETRAG